MHQLRHIDKAGIKGERAEMDSSKDTLNHLVIQSQKNSNFAIVKCCRLTFQTAESFESHFINCHLKRPKASKFKLAKTTGDMDLDSIDKNLDWLQ